MRKKGWLWCGFLSFLLLCGCAEPKVIEEIGLITASGYDPGKNGTILGTLVELKIDPVATNDVVILETESSTIRGIRNAANKKTSKGLASGQLRVILYGEGMFNKGNTGIAESLSTDPVISDLTYLAMADGKARDILQLKAKQIPDIGIHLYNLINQNTKVKIMPSATLQEVLHNHFTVGKDPVLPILKKEGNKEIAFSGVAIFKGSNLVGKISTEQSFYLTLLTDKFKSGSIDIEINSDSSKLEPINRRLNKIVASLDSIGSSSDIKLINKEKVEFDLNVNLTARLLEITSQISLGNPENIKLIEKEINKSMKKEIEKLIAYFQSKESDVVGLGEVYKSSVRHSKLTDEKWYKMLKEAKVNVNLDFTIRRTGLIE
ncbi:Ger(x)C family spore germination protein [Neobacillus niacini]|uniref:Ger(x)C family spore germination protein n=1 Tax=Neobacillus niacini TaxID=86668 RepID=UPI001C8E160B|nr:Ger(x)C family spore germination protein [Neobacillus niacini]MBY0148007.1 Ger(x)C family spore germination protein [Neobacillus niacini]